MTSLLSSAVSEQRLVSLQSASRNIIQICRLSSENVSTGSCISPVQRAPWTDIFVTSHFTPNCKIENPVLLGMVTGIVTL